MERAEGSSADDHLGLLFDASAGSLTAYRNGVKLGVVFQPGEIQVGDLGFSKSAIEPDTPVLGYAWAADLYSDQQGVEIKNVNPAQLAEHNAAVQQAHSGGPASDSE